MISDAPEGCASGPGGAGSEGTPGYRPVDPARLARAVHLEAESLGAGRWRVRGGAAPHIVEVAIRVRRCDCQDARRHPGSCKHVLRVALEALPREVLTALRAVVPDRRMPSEGPPKRSKAFRLAICARAGCGEPLGSGRRHGSPRRFCSAGCRRAAWGKPVRGVRPPTNDEGHGVGG